MAPIANTAAWAASSHALLVIRTMMSTAVVSHAPNRGPLGSMFIAMAPHAFGSAQGRDHVRLARLAIHPVGNVTVRAEHERRGRPPDAQPPDQVEPGLIIDLHVRDAIDVPRHLGKDPPGGSAGRADF